MIRFFALENEYGNRYELDSPEKGFLSDPQGLGYEINSSYSPIGSSFIRNFKKNKQQTITGSVLFVGGNVYQNYQTFVNFINASEKLKLVYITQAGEYLRDIDVARVGKSEITQKKVLECPVDFACRSLFYSNYVDRFRIERVEGEARWDFRWDVRFNDYGTRAVNVSNNGHVEAPFEVEIYGYCENPKITIFKGAEVVASVVFKTTLQEGEKITYSSLDGDLYCYRIDAQSGRENFTSKLDIHNTNFFKLPVGDCTVDFTSDTGAANRTLLTVYKYFRTV
jgi:hypothetical protein|nr:MAG TPA: Baseplate protein [Caudoviricetes sp.]